MANAPLAQLLAHDPGQRAHGCFGDIRHLKPAGVQLVAGTHAADDGRSRRPCLLHHGKLGRYRVDGVHDIVKPGKIQTGRRVRSVKQVVHPDYRVGIDVQHPLPGSLGFVHTNGFVGGQNLPVQIGQADRVPVDEIQLSHPGPGQSLHHIAAHTAQTEYRHPGALQLLHRFFSQQQPRPGKLLLHVVSSCQMG